MTIEDKARWYVTKSKSGHYWATLRDASNGSLIAKSKFPCGTPAEAKWQVLEYLKRKDLNK
jgi:hypothetical protein